MTTGHQSKYRIERARWRPSVSPSVFYGSHTGSARILAVMGIGKAQDLGFKVPDTKVLDTKVLDTIRYGYRKRLLKRI